MHTTSLGGRDSLYSIVQMPSGIPVATVAINGGANAGLLAAKILAVSDDSLLAKLKEYSAKLKAQVEAKDEKLQETGCQEYLKKVNRMKEEIMDYKNAGVDIEAGYQSVELMKNYVKETMRPEVLGGIGGVLRSFFRWKDQKYGKTDACLWDRRGWNENKAGIFDGYQA